MRQGRTQADEQAGDQESWRDDDQDSDIIPFPGVGNRDSFLSMDISSPATPYTAHYAVPASYRITSDTSPLVFNDATDMLGFITRNWLEKYVTSDLKNRDILEDFAIRPFFMLIHVDAPILRRFARCQRCVRYVISLNATTDFASETDITLEQFVSQDDKAVHGYKTIHSSPETSLLQPTPLNDLRSLIHLRVVNDFDSLDQLHTFLDDVNILDQDRLRPAWDTYFMVRRQPLRLFTS
jgi:dCMP deaminase